MSFKGSVDRWVQLTKPFCRLCPSGTCFVEAHIWSEIAVDFAGMERAGGTFVPARRRLRKNAVFRSRNRKTRLRDGRGGRALGVDQGP